VAADGTALAGAWPGGGGGVRELADAHPVRWGPPGRVGATLEGRTSGGGLTGRPGQRHTGWPRGKAGGGDRAEDDRPVRGELEGLRAAG